MSMKIWFMNLGLQIFSVLWAIWLFASPLDRKISGLLAGGLFLAVGLLPLWSLRRHSLRTRWIMFWAALLFLAFSALPIFGLRLIFWGQDFNTIEVGWLKAAQLHSWSSSMFMALLVATLIDGCRFYMIKRKVNT